MSPAIGVLVSIDFESSPFHLPLSLWEGEGGKTDMLGLLTGDQAIINELVAWRGPRMADGAPSVELRPALPPAD